MPEIAQSRNGHVVTACTSRYFGMMHVEDFKICGTVGRSGRSSSRSREFTLTPSGHHLQLHSIENASMLSNTLCLQQYGRLRHAALCANNDQYTTSSSCDEALTDTL
nr:hypothetical protein CFP56_19456 [Quercus suber]